MTPDADNSLRSDLAAAEKELIEATQKVVQLRKQLGPETVKDFVLSDLSGKAVQLSELFGDKDDLIVVHNMGQGCPYCTLWADGFSGVWRHLENRAGFALVTPDAPEVARQFSEGRGWQFKVLSNNGGDFTRSMGYEHEDGSPQPGVSAFHRQDDGTIVRTAHASFGPGDVFCGVWHLFDLLGDGAGGWAPKFSYG